MTYRTLPSLFLVLALGALGCSGESDPPADTDRQDTEHCTKDLVGVVDLDLLTAAVVAQSMPAPRWPKWRWNGTLAHAGARWTEGYGGRDNQRAHCER